MGAWDCADRRAGLMASSLRASAPLMVLRGLGRAEGRVNEGGVAFITSIAAYVGTISTEKIKKSDCFPNSGSPTNQTPNLPRCAFKKKVLGAEERAAFFGAAVRTYMVHPWERQSRGDLTKARVVAHTKQVSVLIRSHAL